MKALSWSSTESIYSNLILYALSHLVRGLSAVKRSPLQKLHGLGDKRNSFFKSIVTAFASEGPKCEIIWQGMSHSVKQDAGSHTACVLPWDRLGTSICSLLWRELRCFFLLQHLFSSGCPAWVRTRQLFLLGCHVASLKEATHFCTRHALIFGVVSAQTCVSLQLSLPAPIYFPCGSSWNLLVSRRFHLQPGKLSGLARETQQPSWSLTLNYFPFTELAAQLEADTGKCTWTQPRFAIESIKLCMALLNNPQQRWAQT